MESANALEIARSLAETSSGQHTALSVKDRQVCVAISVFCALLCLAGCGGNDAVGIPPSVVTNILSNPRFDGDIEQTSPASYTVTQGMSASVQSVLAGIDPVADLSAALGSSADPRTCDGPGYRPFRTGRRHFLDDPGTATRPGGFSSAHHGGSGSSQLHVDGD